jgi:tetratricopeptide (TPR) repeat protein
MAVVCAAIAVGAATSAVAAPDPKGKIPITAASEEARALYVKARDLAEKLRATDAHALYAQALAKDKDFALAHLGFANTSATTKDFFESLGRAVALADKVSPGEALLIRGTDAGAKGDLTRQRDLYEKLTRQFPQDERAQLLLGNYHFNRQDYPACIAAYEQAVKLNPAFTQPYNQLGYAYRFTGKPAEAEKVFKKYIELIPDDPNPYDSYAELLMETGRFDESIKTYEKALAIDKNFIASYIGIGNNQVLLGRAADARKTYAKFFATARTDGERRQALVWTAESYSHEGAPDKALAELEKMRAISTKAGDLATVAQDDNFMANILLEAGRLDEAAKKLASQLAVVEQAAIPAENKETQRRNVLYDEARIAVARGDLAAARAKAAAYGTKVAAKQNPFEVRRHHEVLGLLALAEKKYTVAVAELAQGNQRDPRVLYASALALQGAGDGKAAHAMALRAAHFNSLSLTYGYVRAKATRLATGT